jgi:hypothetical protein
MVSILFIYGLFLFYPHENGINHPPVITIKITINYRWYKFVPFPVTASLQTIVANPHENGDGSGRLIYGGFLTCSYPHIVMDDHFETCSIQTHGVGNPPF